METDVERGILDFELPKHLYVPTPPLWIESKGFNGPLDLLWYLIKQQNIDILDIPVSLIASQYLQYLKLMTSHRFEIAPDYLVMAVRLLQIKSQMMLPKPPREETQEEDPRAFLIKQLTDYNLIQTAAKYIDALPRWNRDIWLVEVKVGGELPPPPLPTVNLSDLQSSYQVLAKNKSLQAEHVVSRPRLSLSERINDIYQQLAIQVPTRFDKILSKSAESLEVAISFQAVLEMSKNQQIVLLQSEWDDLLWLNRIT